MGHIREQGHRPLRVRGMKRIVSLAIKKRDWKMAAETYDQNIAVVAGHSPSRVLGKDDSTRSGPDNTDFKASSGLPYLALSVFCHYIQVEVHIT